MDFPKSQRILLPHMLMI